MRVGLRRLGSAGAAAVVTLGPVLGSVLGAGLVVGVAAPAYADVGQCTGIDDPTTPSDPVTEPSGPIDELQIDKVHERLAEEGKAPGAQLGVAVIDSGILVDDSILPRVFGETLLTKDPALAFHQGTAVAGLIAGRPTPDGDLVGMAPDARLLDLRVYDAMNSDEAQTPVADGLVAGLSRAAELVDQYDIRVVNVSFSTERTPALDAAIQKVTDAGVIVVAASGDRPDSSSEDEEGEDDLSTPKDGENTAAQIWPAGYSVDNPRVLAVSTTAPSGDDSTNYALQSSAIDVAVPTAGAVSYAVNGQTCEIAQPSTAWAAAEVSGILTLVMSAFPEDSPEQTLARLQDTATGHAQGNDALPNRRTGRGVVQPLAAIERVIDPSEDGSVAYSSRLDLGPQRAELPGPQPDHLESTRKNAVWWGLGGGGALIVAMLLRPVLSRRRS